MVLIQREVAFYDIQVYCLKAQAERTIDEPVRLPGDHGEREPPDPISNSEVKLFRADDSVKLFMRK